MMPDALSDILAIHYQLYQSLEPRDIYKLLYQRVFGPEHSIGDWRAAREHLYLEALQLPDASVSIPVVDPLSSVLCRVNLRPFIQAGGDIGRLWKVFRQTVHDFQSGTLTDFQREWTDFRNTSWARRDAPELLEQFWQCMATADFPPVHHSRSYSEAHAPHYRVVLCTRAQQAAL